jgi:hypothetical protein
MDMKKILQALDSTSSKPVEGSDNMKQFLSIVTEGANPHKVTLPVQMAMQHYAEPKVEQPKTIKEVKKTAMSSMLYQYYTDAEKKLDEEAAAKKEIISEQARRIADRVLNKNRVVENEDHDPAEYDQEGEMAENHFGALKHAVGELESMIHPNDNLPEWVQDKITLATDYIETVRDYMIGDKDKLHEMHRDAYQRDQDAAEYGLRGEHHRDFKRREMEHELGHETNNYAVSINGKQWKVFGSRQEANRVSNAMERKYPGKKIGVHATGAPVSEGSK